MNTEVVRVPSHHRYLHALAAADGTESELSAVLRNYLKAFRLQFQNPFQATARTSLSPRQDLLTDQRYSLPLLLPLSPGTLNEGGEGGDGRRMGGRYSSQLFGEVGSWCADAHPPYFFLLRKLVWRTSAQHFRSSVQRVQLRGQFLSLFLKIFHARGGSATSMLWLLEHEFSAVLLDLLNAFRLRFWDLSQASSRTSLFASKLAH